MSSKFAQFPVLTIFSAVLIRGATAEGMLTPPEGYEQQCALEKGLCACTGKVIYGNGNGFTDAQDNEGCIECNNGVFPNTIGGSKRCYCNGQQDLDGNKYATCRPVTKVATEWDMATCDGEVRYGNNNGFTTWMHSDPSKEFQCCHANNLPNCLFKGMEGFGGGLKKCECRSYNWTPPTEAPTPPPTLYPTNLPTLYPTPADPLKPNFKFQSPMSHVAEGNTWPNRQVGNPKYYAEDGYPVMLNWPMAEAGKCLVSLYKKPHCQGNATELSVENKTLANGNWYFSMVVSGEACVAWMWDNGDFAGPGFAEPAGGGGAFIPGFKKNPDPCIELPFSWKTKTKGDHWMNKNPIPEPEAEPEAEPEPEPEAEPVSFSIQKGNFYRKVSDVVVDGKRSGAKNEGGFCTCPDGQVYAVETDVKAQYSLKCANGASSPMHPGSFDFQKEYGRDWDGAGWAVTCARAAVNESTYDRPCRNGDVKLTEPGADPLIYMGGVWSPLCIHYTQDNKWAATHFCKKLGYDGGFGTNFLTGTFKLKFGKGVNAWRPGRCTEFQDLFTCSTGGNSHNRDWHCMGQRNDNKAMGIVCDGHVAGGRVASCNEALPTSELDGPPPTPPSAMCKDGDVMLRADAQVFEDDNPAPALAGGDKPGSGDWKDVLKQRGDKKKYGEEETVNLIRGTGTPYVLMNQTWVPVCAQGFRDNNFGAQGFCKHLGLEGGVAGQIGGQNRGQKGQLPAIAVGRCLEGQSLLGCTGGGNSYAFDNDMCISPTRASLTVACDSAFTGVAASCSNWAELPMRNATSELAEVRRRVNMGMSERRDEKCPAKVENNNNDSVRFPSEVLKCPVTPVTTTSCGSLKSQDIYPRIVQRVVGVYESLPTHCDEVCCPQADLAACVLRLAGHDFMDFDPKTGAGGSDGCLDFHDTDNKGLFPCLAGNGEFGLGLTMEKAYTEFCGEVSLADFIVVAAEAMMMRTRPDWIGPDAAAQTPSPTPAPPPQAHANYYRKVGKDKGTSEWVEYGHSVGGWGGTCTCPDGQVYQVGDNFNGCKSIACVGGVSGECGPNNPGGGGMAVTCQGAGMSTPPVTAGGSQNAWTSRALDFGEGYKFGREARATCAPGPLPNAERSCDVVEETFVDKLGLTWAQSAALMGVHTLGRASRENSGYDGWWNEGPEGREFTNSYYVSLLAKGWMPREVQPGRNQWRRSDTGSKVEMMLNTDLCLLFETEAKVDGDGTTSRLADASADTCCAWALDAPKALGAVQSQCKGGTAGPDECCQDGGGLTCNNEEDPQGSPAADAVKQFANDEQEWLKTFLPAWRQATTLGSSGLFRPSTCASLPEKLDAVSKAPTPAPTNAPTAMPTNAPTAHPCADGSHGCDKGTGGICYQAMDGSNGWTCGCKTGYYCSAGCAAPLDGHTCVEITNHPTMTPTKFPTPIPTPSPTDGPTKAPTKTPTDAPTHFPTDGPTHSPTHAPTLWETPTDDVSTPTTAPTSAPTDCLSAVCPTVVPSCPEGSRVTKAGYAGCCFDASKDCIEGPKTLAPTPKPTLSPTPKPTNPPLPNFDATDPLFDTTHLHVVTQLNEVMATLTPTVAPTAFPTKAGFTVATKQRPVKALAAQLSFSLTEAEALNPVMRAALAEGVAAALGFDKNSVRVTKINGVPVGGHAHAHAHAHAHTHARRRLVEATAVEFELVSSNDAQADAEALEASVRTAATSGAIVANVQLTASTMGVLTQQLKDMERAMPEPALAIVDTTITDTVQIKVTASATNPAFDGLDTQLVSKRNGEMAQLKQGDDFTTTCSHVKCSFVQKAGTRPFLAVHHHSEEAYGHKHVCKHGMHASGKCGCECFDESYGLTEFAGLIADEIGAAP